MKFVDDLNREPKDASCGACVFLIPGLTWATRVVENYANDRSLQYPNPEGSLIFVAARLPLK